MHASLSRDTLQPTREAGFLNTMLLQDQALIRPKHTHFSLPDYYPSTCATLPNAAIGYRTQS